MDDKPSIELQRLVSKYLDGGLDRAGLDRLEQLLRGDEQACGAYLALA